MLSTTNNVGDAAERFLGLEPHDWPRATLETHRNVNPDREAMEMRDDTRASLRAFFAPFDDLAGVLLEEDVARTWRGGVEPELCHVIQNGAWPNGPSLERRKAKITCIRQAYVGRKRAFCLISVTTLVTSRK